MEFVWDGWLEVGIERFLTCEWILDTSIPGLP
jgi:hypothetical protein